MLRQPNEPLSTTLAPRGLRLPGAAAYCGCSVWALRSAIWTGRLKARMIGRALIVLREDLDAYLDSLPCVEPKAQGPAGMASGERTMNGPP